MNCLVWELYLNTAGFFWGGGVGGKKRWWLNIFKTEPYSKGKKWR